MADPPPRDPTGTASRDRTPDAAERLLDREAPPGYLEAWAAEVAEPAAARGDALFAATLFRLGDERFLLDGALVRDVHVPRRVHRVPGRTNDVFRGIVCLRGELHPCADLHALLGCRRVATPAEGTAARTRMVVVGRPGERWAFEADEVVDVRRYEERAVAPPQVTVAKASVRFSDGVVALHDGPAARLDPERLLAGLARSLA